MDHFGFLKRGWDITWRYKHLWVLGFFAGAAGSVSSGSSYQFSGESLGAASDIFGRWLEQNAGVIGVIMLIGIALWFVAIAAQGAIAHATNEAAEERTPALGQAWSVGFSKWGRIFMIQLVLALPVLVLALVLILLVAAAIAAGAVDGGSGAAGATVGLCIGVPVVLLAFIAVLVIASMLSMVAVRYGVLVDVTFWQAVQRAWEDLWGKRGVFTFWLVMVLPAMAYSILAVLLTLPAVTGMAAFGRSAEQGAAFLLLALIVVISVLLNAIYSTFVHASWTVYFRAMTGAEAAIEAMPPSPEGPALQTSSQPPSAYPPPPPPRSAEEPPSRDE